jgi:RNA polymerase sigma-70 factor (ECF subfamily)
VPRGAPKTGRPIVPRSEEQRLVARARRGSADAFHALVDAYKERLFGFVWRMIRDHHEAEDICQAAFVKAYEALDSYNEKYAFSTWLFTIAYRLCLNHLRKRKPYSGDVDFGRIARAEADAPQTLASTEEARRLRNEIWAAVEQLKPAQKTAVLLFYREGKSCEEIGRVLEVPTVTVKSHLHRARGKLRAALSAELVDDWLDVDLHGETRTA